MTAPAKSNEVWALRLYVAGQTPKSITAFANLKKICEAHLAGRYTIEVVDLLQQPQLAAGDQIVAIPTLVRKLPEPLRKIVGDLSNTERALVGLQLRPAKSGIGLTVIKSNAPVVPVRVYGTFEAYGKHVKFPRPHPVTAVFGKPMYFEALRAEAKTCSKPRLKEIYQQVADELMARIAELRPD